MSALAVRWKYQLAPEAPEANKQACVAMAEASRALYFNDLMNQVYVAEATCALYLNVRCSAFDGA